MWRRPALPVRVRTSTIGSARLNFRVRYENGWFPCDMITTYGKMRFSYTIQVPLRIHNCIQTSTEYVFLRNYLAYYQVLTTKLL